MTELDRRNLLLSGAAFMGLAATGSAPAYAQAPDVLFDISLAQWSLHRALYGDQGKPPSLDPLDFPVVARQTFDIGAVEYVNSFYQGKARDRSYLTELKTRADGEGVISHLIMCDGEGRLGDPDVNQRRDSVERHKKWADMAAVLGCRHIRVNANSEGEFIEQQRLAADGLRQLAEYTAQFGMNVLVENHGGYSSHGCWLAGVMDMADHPNVGTLPDFGNFRISDKESYDIYKGVKELMPYAKAVSAKSFRFDASGNEVGIDYDRMMRIVLDAGFRGYVGIEFEGHEDSETDGVFKTKALLERMRTRLTPRYQ
ncbi:MAG: sugar phosphate isomerase/epimerase family protein [Henriciella sp.]|nr:sugar phosphate isomerase/epimerase family protein [Henriciella sp.]